MTESREIKVKIREGTSRQNNPAPPGRTMDSLGKFLERKVPESMVQSRTIEPDSNQKVSINRMINRGREHQTMARSTRREWSNQANSRSRSSLKHEVKIRSISRSRNLINLDEYCNKIERESRYLSGSIQNERQSRQHGNKIETLMNSLRKIQKKPVTRPMNNDYYALGRANAVSVRAPQRTRRSEEAQIPESQLRKIRQMFPFNQVWFWEMTPREQESKLGRFNPDLVDQLRLPVKVLISKVRQSDQISGPELFGGRRNEVERKKGRGRCKLFGQNRKFNVDSREDNVEYNEDPKFNAFNGGARGRPRQEEPKGAPMGGGRGHVEEEEFSGMDFNNRRQNQGFNNVGFKDRRHHDREIKRGGRPREREVGGGRPPGFKYGPPRTNVQTRQGVSRVAQSSRSRSQVRIRNKRRNYENKEFVTVNRKVVDKGTRNYQTTHTTTNRHKVHKPVHTKRANQGQGHYASHKPYYSQRHINQNTVRHQPNVKYVDRIQVRNDDESEDFDDDYFEERDHKRIQKKVHVGKGVGPSGARQISRGQPQVRGRNPPQETVYVEQIEIPKDSEEEDYGDDYFEERERFGKKKTQNRNVQRKRGGGARIKSRQAPQEKVFVDKIVIQKDPDESDDYDDDYFEERDKQYRSNQGGRRVNAQARGAKQNHVPKGNKRQARDSSDVVYVENVVIQKDPDESDDYDDDYFEERDSWRNKKRSNRERPKRGRNENVFTASSETSKVAQKYQPGFSGINKINPHSSQAGTDSHISSRFKSFGPGNMQGKGSSLNGHWEKETHTVQIESKNEMSPDQYMTSREMKGPRDEQHTRSGLKKSEKQTHYTSSTYQNSGRKTETKAKDFSNPYSAQIFTDEQTYVHNRAKGSNQSRYQKSDREQTFTDYYRTNR